MIAHKINLTNTNAQSIIDQFVTPLSPSERDKWEHGTDRISVSTLDDNMDKAESRRAFLMQNPTFRRAYESLTPDQQLCLSLLLIAHEDLRTLAEIEEYQTITAF